MAAAGAICGLPAASVCVAETLIVPSPSVPRSPAASTTGWEKPVPVTVLVTGVRLGPAKVTLIAAPTSPVTVTTPTAGFVASAAVAPVPMLAVAIASNGAAGATVSSVKLVEACGLVVPNPSI